jgi:hypothetical protein
MFLFGEGVAARYWKLMATLVKCADWVSVAGQPFVVGLLWSVKAISPESAPLPSGVSLHKFEVQAFLTLRMRPVIGFLFVLLTILCSALTAWHSICLAPWIQSHQSCLSEYWLPSFLQTDLSSGFVVATLFALICLLLLKFGKFFRLTSFNVYFTNDATLSRRIAGANRHRSYVMVSRDHRRLECVVEDWNRADALKKGLSKWFNEGRRVISLSVSNSKEGLARGYAPLGLEQLIRFSMKQEPSRDKAHEGQEPDDEAGAGATSRRDEPSPSRPVVDLKPKTLALYRTPLRLYFALMLATVVFVIMQKIGFFCDNVFPKITLSTMALLIAAVALIFHLRAIGRTFTAWLSTPTMQPFRAFEERWVRNEFRPDSEEATAWAQVGELESWRFSPALVKIAPGQDMLHIGLFLSVEIFLHLVHILK